MPHEEITQSREVQSLLSLIAGLTGRNPEIERATLLALHVIYLEGFATGFAKAMAARELEPLETKKKASS